VVQVKAESLAQPEQADADAAAALAFVAAAARISDALAQDTLLAPLDAPVLPLPHQIRALSRAVASDRVRFLLADEVGLGKTIEAGLILRELKLRGLVRRVLVVAPRGLVLQWVSEMRTHFHEEFHLVIPAEVTQARHPLGLDNLWRTYDQVVCPMDSVKPLEARRGWSPEQVAEYNRARFEDLIAAGWDLVIVDEAHRLGGSTEQVARYRLGRGLAEAAPFILLLSATPHQGKTEAFHRLMSLVDPAAFPDPSTVTRERVRRYVIRTEKRRAIDAQGKPLFQPRHTRLIPVSWEDRHAMQQILYEAVTEYVRQGYNKALRERKTYLGFLMLLMQRLVTSSTRAIRTTLERRLEVLQEASRGVAEPPPLLQEEWMDLDGQQQLESLWLLKPQVLHDEREEVESLLQYARRTELHGPDAKAEALLDWIYRLQQEEGDPHLKVLIFTEFVPTQQMLAEFLEDRNLSVVCLNGSMDLEARLRAQESFAGPTRVLISTDAGGEGLNLQFCHVVINYDMPWNPMRLEQRIGRVDRIGQAHPVRALNLLLQDTVECRVQEVLQEKLQTILAEFGVDKTGDVLDSARAEQLFEDLFIEAILHPESLTSRVDSAARQIRQVARETREADEILRDTDPLDPLEARRFLSHPLRDWVERMTLSYLRAHGGSAVQRQTSWDLTWPDGTVMRRVVFQAGPGQTDPSYRHLTLEDPRVRGLIARIPRFVRGRPVSRIRLAGLPAEVEGYWSLWKVAVHTPEWKAHRILALFLDDQERSLAATARRIWELLLTSDASIAGRVPGEEAARALDRSARAAEEHGRPIYEELIASHHRRLDAEREKGEVAFTARRRAVEGIGLTTVRAHRLAQLDQEQRAWAEKLEAASRTLPELFPVVLVRVERAAR
jgi:superfamily II DNA or RNA helicase